MTAADERAATPVVSRNARRQRLHVLMGLRADHLTLPHPSRLAPSDERFAEVVRRHSHAVAAGEVTYRDPTTGYSVFTAAFLAQRGYCCDSGCRHCPFVGGPESV